MLRAVVENAPELVAVTDQFGLIQYLNATANQLGYDPAELVGTSILDLLHPDEAADAARFLASTAAVAGVKEPIEVRLRRASGEYRTFEIIATNLLEDATVRGIVFHCRDLTERYEQQRRFRLLFEQSPVPQVLVVPDHPGAVANEAFAALFGYDREELLTRDLAELVADESREAHLLRRAELEHGLRSSSVATRVFRRKSGEQFHGRAATSAVRDHNDRLEYMLATVEDISESVAAAAALAESEARFKAIVNHSADIIAIIYPDGQWEASDQGTRLLGYPKGYEPEGGVLSLVHPEDLPVAAAALQEIIDGTRDHSNPVELRLRAADGSYWDYECVGQNLAHEFDVGGVVVTARDVTARKRAERIRGRAESRFRTAFERAPMGVSLINLEGRLLDVNAAACTMVGRTREEMLQLDPTAVLHPEDVDLAIDVTMRQLAGEDIEGEFRLLRSDGTEVWVLSSATLYEPAEGGDPFLITMQMDVTERKQLQERLAWEATRDPLTGLLNRGAFVTHLELALARRDSPDFALLFIDLDKFKPVNDTLGHEAGDSVLVAIAERIAAASRRGDVVARLGGDEFVIAYHGPEVVKNLTVASERLCAVVAEPVTIRGQVVSVGASIGAAVARDHDTVASLMHRADEAAYKAKQAGGSRVVIAEADSEVFARSAATPRP